MSKELHPHWRSTEPSPPRGGSGEARSSLLRSSPLRQGFEGRAGASDGQAKIEARTNEPTNKRTNEQTTKRHPHPLTVSLLASVGIVLFSSLFTVGVRNLTAQLSQGGAAVLRVTTQGMSPMELSMDGGDILVVEWLHPAAGSVRSREKNERDDPLLQTAELTMGGSERVTVASAWNVASLTLEASVHPNVTATVLIAGKEKGIVPASQIVSSPTLSVPLAPAQQPSPEPVPVSPSSDSSTSSASSDSSPPLPPPSLTPTPTTPISPEVSLEAPILPRTTAPPALRVNRFTVGSPLVPQGTPAPVPLEALGGGGVPSLRGVSYPELVLTPPATTPAQAFIPPPPPPRVRRQPEDVKLRHVPRTGPFLGGLVALCAVASMLIVGRKMVKRGKRKK